MIGWLLVIFGKAIALGATILPGINILQWLRIASYIAILGAGSFGTVKAMHWWHRNDLTPKQAKEQCASTVALATLEARTKALAEREGQLRLRELAVAQDEKTVQEAQERMEADRAASAGSDDSRVVVPGDDEWLRGWRKQSGVDRTRNR